MGEWARARACGRRPAADGGPAAARYGACLSVQFCNCMLLCCRRCSIGAARMHAIRWRSRAGPQDAASPFVHHPLPGIPGFREGSAAQALAISAGSCVATLICLCTLLVRYIYLATSGRRPAGRGRAMSRAGPGAWPAFGGRRDACGSFTYVVLARSRNLLFPI